MTRRTHIIDSLEDEHRLIAEVTDAFGRFLNAIDEVGEVDRADLSQFARFFVEFADQRHHEKEEDILMPALVHTSLRWDEGPLSQLRADHEQERYFIEAFQQLAAQSAALSMEDQRHLVSVGREFIELGHRHMGIEQDHVYPIARTLPGEQIEALTERLTTFEQSVGPEGASELELVARGLIDKYPSGAAA